MGSAGKVLCNNANKALHRSKTGPVNHDGAFFGPVCGRIFEVEAARQLVIQLNCSALPEAAETVLDVEIQFRTVKCAVAFIDLVLHADAADCIRQRSGCNIPVLFCADVILRHRCKLDPIGKTEFSINFLIELCNANHFIPYLLRGNQQMGVVLGKAANPEQTVQSTGKFVAVHKTKFRIAQRQILIGVRLQGIHQDAARTVHRLNGIFFVINNSGIHVFFVMVPVSGSFPKVRRMICGVEIST